MKAIIVFVIVAVITFLTFLYRALQISGRNNDDKQQLEYIWKWQKRTKSSK